MTARIRLAPALLLFAFAALSGCASAASPQPADRCVAGAPVPDVYLANVLTSKGPFVIEVHRDWAPASADHFHQLVCAKFYSQARFYRVVKGFVAQFGMNADPAVHRVWQERKLKDEPVLKSNRRGTIAFTGSAAPDSRTTHLFINRADNLFLDTTTAAPFGLVTSGMEVVDSIYDGYEDGPEQDRLWKEGNPYLLKEFPDLDFILEITLG
jgi:peptidyl-prolyl cis-trans isomerase A (cyclophilin A)